MIVTVFLITSPDLGVPGLVWLISPYSILFGFALVVLGMRLRQLRLEMTHA
jgi:hypothetical protein